jgi:hypothetical protein
LNQGALVDAISSIIPPKFGQAVPPTPAVGFVWPGHFDYSQFQRWLEVKLAEVLPVGRPAGLPGGSTVPGQGN